MKQLIKYLDDIISDDAISHKIKYAETHQNPEVIWFYSDLPKILAGYAEKNAREKARESGMDYDLCLTQEIYLTASEFMEEQKKRSWTNDVRSKWFHRLPAGEQQIP